MIDRLRTGTLLRYAALAVPLAFVGLPIYVHIPKFYGQTRGMDLALLGAILLIVRLADCFLDPLIGWLRDRYPSARRAMMRVAVVGLMLGYWLVFTPPDGLSPWVQATALGGSLALVYFSFSVLMVHYYAAGVALATLAQDAPRVAAFRESFMLAGVLLASILPPLLAQHMAQQAYHILALIFAPMLLVGAFITMGLPPFAAQQTPAAPLGLGGIATCWRNDGIRRVLVILFFNSIPGAITGTLFLKAIISSPTVMPNLRILVRLMRVLSSTRYSQSSIERVMVSPLLRTALSTYFMFAALPACLPTATPSTSWAVAVKFVSSVNVIVQVRVSLRPSL
jgi:glycoside/pentoside/hexuronide:cation symporter, GPH family